MRESTKYRMLTKPQQFSRSFLVKHTSLAIKASHFEKIERPKRSLIVKLSSSLGGYLSNGSDSTLGFQVAIGLCLRRCTYSIFSCFERFEDTTVGGTDFADRLRTVVSLRLGSGISCLV
ncbi:hypothetical protein L596_000534 [Steinernema carpocapsae]|uniref:Uncharacterized protein n=1 Tax=Steinernema carpocapsae TaxID=34508 RepID=A0A4U8UJS8_STECR|nr:hypothetical protein L596_000534 [Steinernema carpocapsae]